MGYCPAPCVRPPAKSLTEQEKARIHKIYIGSNMRKTRGDWDHLPAELLVLGLL